MPLRVVYDTNVMISGLLWRGPPYRCLQLARSGVVEACYCRAMLDELSEKLTGKFDFSPERVQEVVHDWRSKATEVQIRGDLRIVSADPEDDVFLDCAVAAGARILVSGDRHLLYLGRYEGIEIVRAAAFLTTVRTMPVDDVI